MRKRLAGVRGSIAVETAITLPLVLLLTVGGISVLLWLHHKTWMQALVAETARERAADAAWTGYYKDIRDSVRPADAGPALVDARLFSFHLPADPPLVVAGACASPAGQVLRIGTDGASGTGSPGPEDQGGWLSPVRALRGQISRWLERLEGLAAEAEDRADAAVALAEQAVWYRRLADNLAAGDPFRARQAMDYLAGAAVEELVALPCLTDGSGGVVLTAKVVIQGERTFGQR